VLLHLKAIRKLMCLKMFVTFLICGDEYVKVFCAVVYGSGGGGFWLG
jgi:hypothetical protein